MPDNSRFDHRENATLLPVRSFFKSPEKLPLLSTAIVAMDTSERNIWCGTKYEIILIFDITPTQISSCEKVYHKSRYEASENEEVCSLVVVKGNKGQYVWTLTTPSYKLNCWSASSRSLISSVDVTELTKLSGRSIMPSVCVCVCVCVGGCVCVHACVHVCVCL